MKINQIYLKIVIQGFWRSLITDLGAAVLLVSPVAYISCAVEFLYIHVHNWTLQPFSRDYDLASYTIHVLCFIIIFVHERPTDLPESFFYQNFCYKSTKRPSIAEDFFLSFVMLEMFEMGSEP